MGTLTTYDDSVRREDIVGKKPKSFDKKSYWNTKRTQKNKAKKRKR